MGEQKIVDLSYRVSNEMIVYPGNERPSFRWISRANSEGCNVTRATMNVHTGTHVDAPLHFLDDTQTIDAIDPSSLFGSCKMFRYAKALESQAVTLDEVLASGIDLAEGDIFLLATGIEALAETSRYNYSYPYPSRELVQWLIERKIRAYMTDATSIDPVSSPAAENHHLILGAGIPIVENLRNLAELPALKPFVICALPLKLGGREGSPCRAVALPGIATLRT